MTEQIFICPLCSGELDSTRIAELNLSHDEFVSLQAHIQNGTLKEVFRTYEIAKRLLGDSKNVNMDLNFKNLEGLVTGLVPKISLTIENVIKSLYLEQNKDNKDLIKGISNLKDDVIRYVRDVEKQTLRCTADTVQNIDGLKQAVTDLSLKFGNNTAIGNTIAGIVLTKLKEALNNTTDTFSDERANKHGTDIIQTVRDKGTICGTISISVKDTQEWEDKYITQLKKNMKEDGSKIGILATRTFPSEALSAEMYVYPDVSPGNIIILVKLEMAPIACAALRYLAIHLFDSSQNNATKQIEMDETTRTLNKLISFINGTEFQETIGCVDIAIQRACETRAILNNLENYTHNQIRKSNDFLNTVERELNHAKDKLVVGLRDILKGSRTP
jgi:hypothetical protein